MVDAGVWATLGSALRREAGAGGGPLIELVGGARCSVRIVRASLGAVAFDAMVHEGVLVIDAERSDVACRARLLASPELVLAAPDAGHRPDMVYIGPDSPLLVEVVLRLAPRGERAVDLGTGTGLLAAALSRRYRCVVATDIVRRAAEAARCTMMLNDRPPGHVWLTAQTDVTCGLRTRSFDLVAANTPWVPASVDADTPVSIYANGGRDGLELPARFLVEGAALLRPGGVAVLLALHVVRTDGARPLMELCGNLEQEGYSVAVVPTPLNRTFPQLSTKTLARCPDLVEAIHVAVVIGAPVTQGGRRDSLLVACDGLARRWQTETLSLGVMA
jgi:release factor glutamine methyltransferase